jgi:hypothetical protein
MLLARETVSASMRAVSRNRIVVAYFTVVGGVFPTACERATVEPAMRPINPVTIRLDSPDPYFRLSAEERALVRQGFDADALERLLSHIEPAFRPVLLKDFLQPEIPGEWTLTVQMGDPELQPLLDEVWAKGWEELGIGEIDAEESDYPGKQLARRRLLEKRNQPEKH